MNPQVIYKGKGWIGWRDWMGPNNKWLTYREARRILRSEKLHTTTDYSKWFRQFDMSKKRWNGKRMHHNPQKCYQDVWISWNHFLSHKPIARFISFNKARKFARALNLNTYSEWLDYCKTGAKPKNIPANPYVTYSEKFKGWPDFLGNRRGKKSR